MTVRSLRGTGTGLGAVVVCARLAQRYVEVSSPGLPQMPWEMALILSLNQLNKQIAEKGYGKWPLN